jgi:Predicted signaling protein consisting of a modified GGDEF domain and a DHH domain
MNLVDKRVLFKNKLKKASNVFIMGHKDLDLDALGAALGISLYASEKGKKNYIVIDDRRLELGTKKTREKVKNDFNFIRGREAKKLIDKKSLLIIVDTNKRELFQNKELFSIINNTIIIDHHDLNENSIQEALMIVDEDASSTCEMVAELLEYDKIKVSTSVATALLSGIMLDTNNYVLKTTSRTFKISYYLTKCGVDPIQVQYLLKQDLKFYIARQKVITEVKLIKKVALAKGKQREKYRREDLAKIADTLLLFNGVESSFAIGRIDDTTIGISARSLGHINVGKILEVFNGGGDEYEAAAKISNKTVTVVRNELMEIIKCL